MAGLLLLLAAPAHADGPPRYSIGNFTEGDASPENYFEISGGVDHTQNFESVYLEKTVSPKSSFSIFGGYQRYEADGDDEGVSGFTNIGLAYKYMFLNLPQPELILSAAPTLELPVGSRNIGEESHPRGGGEVLFEKGFLHLPDSASSFRAIYVEGDVGWDSKITGARDDQVYADLDVGYALQYLNADVVRRAPSFVHDLAPYLEFSWAQYISAHRNSSQPDFELTPAISWYNDTYSVSLGVQVPVNGAAQSNGAVSFVWALGVYYDQLVPALGRNLFQ